MLLSGFSPVYRCDAEILILGSMPGAVSLTAQEYYAHPRNAFWRIIEAFHAEALPHDYDARLELLMSHKIALWDVLGYCRREGSLDSNIESGSESVNDFAGLFHELPKLRLILFNGKKAHATFVRFVVKNKSVDLASLSLKLMPSTSPAYAAMSLEDKKVLWLSALI